MTDDNEEQTDRPFNAYRVPRSDAARAVIAAVRGALDSTEQRARRRRPADEARYSATLGALVSDALYHGLTGERGALTVPRSNATLDRYSRYRPPAIGGTLPTVVDRLADQGYLSVTAGRWSRSSAKGSRSTIKATPRLLRLAARHRLTLADFGRDGAEEIIVRKAPRPEATSGPRPEAPLDEYDDDAQTNKLRAEVETINAALAAASLDFEESALRRRRGVDSADRKLRRVFTRGSFASGGRLFGGFWQPLKKAERLEGLTIAEEEVVELDFSGMGPRLLYGIAGAVPRFHDAYALPGFEGCREGIKKVFGAEMFRDAGGPGQRFPRGTRSMFPATLTYADVRRALSDAHPAIAHLLGTDVGHEVQYLESCIMVEVLLRLGRRGVVALPIHDAVLVGHSHAALAASIMEQVTLDHLGYAIPVRRSH